MSVHKKQRRFQPVRSLVGVAALIALIAGSIVARSVTSTGSAQAAYPGDNGRIAWSGVSAPGAPVNIFTVGADGSNLLAIPRTIDGVEYAEMEPTWSPDGSKLAFAARPTASPSAPAHIWVMDADGSNPRRLTSGSTDEVMPTWSPDGSKVMYTAFAPDMVCDLWTVDVNDSTQTRITDTPGPSNCEWVPAWSPDGTKVAYMNIDLSGGPAAAIDVANVDGSGTTQLVGPSPILGPGSHLDWSPDGGRLIYADGHGSLFIVNSDGSSSHRITSLDEAYYPVWSPDGTRIAYFGVSSEAPYTTAILTADPDGSRIQVVTDAAVDPGNTLSLGLSWQPLTSSPTTTPAPTTASTTVAPRDTSSLPSTGASAHSSAPPARPVEAAPSYTG